MNACRMTAAILLTVGVFGCEDPAANSGSGNGIPNVSNTPTSQFGKAVKAGKDTRDALSSGGNSREAAVLNAKIKLDQLGETIKAMKERHLPSAATEAVEEADRLHGRALTLVENAEQSTAPDDGSEVKKIRDAVAEVDAAVNKARGKLGGGGGG